MKYILSFLLIILTSNLAAEEVELKCVQTTPLPGIKLSLRINLDASWVFSEQLNRSIDITVTDDFISWDYPVSEHIISASSVLHRSSLVLITSSITTSSFELQTSTDGNAINGSNDFIYQCNRGI